MALEELVPFVSPGRKIIQFLLQHFRSVKIASPSSETFVHTGELKISGTYRLAWGGDFILCHRIGHRYWPYVTVDMSARDRTWTANFTIQSPDRTADETHIVLVELDATGRLLVDYFLKNAEKIDWPAIEMIKTPPGFHLRDQITVRRKTT